MSATARVHDAVDLKAVDLKAVVSDLGGPLVDVQGSGQAPKRISSSRRGRLLTNGEESDSSILEAGLTFMPSGRLLEWLPRSEPLSGWVHVEWGDDTNSLLPVSLEANGTFGDDGFTAQSTLDLSRSDGDDLVSPASMTLDIEPFGAAGFEPVAARVSVEWDEDLFPLSAQGEVGYGASSVAMEGSASVSPLAASLSLTPTDVDWMDPLAASASLTFAPSDSDSGEEEEDDPIFPVALAVNGSYGADGISAPSTSLATWRTSWLGQ